MQTITLRLRLHQPTKAKQAVYRELAVRVTGLANNLVAAGRPKKLTSKTAKPYCPDRIPSAVI
ncbi:MAG TPA: transposase, partial [Firmicutes bacterium]|nr:transposase [Bacillota bacterium]